MVEISMGCEGTGSSLWRHMSPAPVLRRAGPACFGSAVDQRLVALEMAEGGLAIAESLVDGGEVEVRVGEGVIEGQGPLVGRGGLREALLVLERDAQVED